jgi:glycosyltransferase involved in cell wall biosynthesis
LEIILVDDGSTDDGDTILGAYAQNHPNIRVIHKANEGLLMTRRRGFSEARGDWFICVDSDDYVAPTLLERVVAMIEKTGADMVMYNFEYFNAKGIHSPSRLKFIDGEIFEGEDKRRIYEKRLLCVDVNMMWMRAIKREILDFDTDYTNCGIRNMCEDALQVLPLYTNAQRIACIEESLYYYRKGDDSITGRTTLDNWRSSQALFAHTEKYLKIWNVSDEVAARFYTGHLEFLCNYIRWLVSVGAGELPASVQEMIVRLKNAPDFIASRQKYRKKYAHSRYLAILVPLLTHAVQTENPARIRLILKTEARLMGLKKTVSGHRK